MICKGMKFYWSTIFATILQTFVTFLPHFSIKNGTFLGINEGYCGRSVNEYLWQGVIISYSRCPCLGMDSIAWGWQHMNVLELPPWYLSTTLFIWLKWRWCLHLFRKFFRSPELFNFVVIFGISMGNVFKWIQTSLCLVQWLLR